MEEAGQLCVWCERPVSGSIFAPFCCRECKDEAGADPGYFCGHCGEPALPSEKDDEGRCADCQEALAVTRITSQ